jgi:hypothetical protein
MLGSTWAMKKHTILTVSVLATLLSNLPYSVGIAIEEQQKSDFPSGALANFPGFHLLMLKERDSDTRAFLASHFPKSNPSVVHADFDGDGHQDYALLLKSDKSSMTKLVVLLCSDDDHCRNVYEQDVTTYSDLVFLLPVNAASSKLTRIQVTYFEKGKVLLYWNEKLKKIKEFQTAD